MKISTFLVGLSIAIAATSPALARQCDIGQQPQLDRYERCAYSDDAVALMKAHARLFVRMKGVSSQSLRDAFVGAIEFVQTSDSVIVLHDTGEFAEGSTWGDLVSLGNFHLYAEEFNKNGKVSVQINSLSFRTIARKQPDNEVFYTSEEQILPHGVSGIRLAVTVKRTNGTVACSFTTDKIQVQRSEAYGVNRDTVVNASCGNSLKDLGDVSVQLQGYSLWHTFN